MKRTLLFFCILNLVLLMAGPSDATAEGKHIILKGDGHIKIEKGMVVHWEPEPKALTSEEKIKTEDVEGDQIILEKGMKTQGEPRPGALSSEEKIKTEDAESVDEINEIVVNIDRDFHYVSHGWPMGLSVGETLAEGMSKQPFESLLKEPGYPTDRVSYGYLEFGNSSDKKISFALNELNNDTWVLYVDANNNEDLSDDGPAYESEVAGKFAVRFSVDVDVLLSSEGMIQRPYNLYLWLGKWLGEKKVKFYAQCYYEGSLSFDGEHFTAIAYEMYNHDALYKENGLWIDLDKNGELDEEREHFSDGSLLTFNGKEYTLRLNYP